jgi:hypothetical protein
VTVYIHTADLVQNLPATLFLDIFIDHAHVVNVNQFPLTPMGVLAPGSAHARPSAQPPIDVSGYFSAHVSAESPSNISPNPSEVISEVSEP